MPPPSSCRCFRHRRRKKADWRRARGMESYGLMLERRNNTWAQLTDPRRRGEEGGWRRRMYRGMWRHDLHIQHFETHQGKIHTLMLRNICSVQRIQHRFETFCSSAQGCLNVSIQPQITVESQRSAVNKRWELHLHIKSPARVVVALISDQLRGLWVQKLTYVHLLQWICTCCGWKRDKKRRPSFF